MSKMFQPPRGSMAATEVNCSYCQEADRETPATWYAEHDELGTLATACNEHQGRMWDAWGITDGVDIRPVKIEHKDG